jgi:hypothetical protein
MEIRDFNHNKNFLKKVGNMRLDYEIFEWNGAWFWGTFTDCGYFVASVVNDSHHILASFYNFELQVLVHYALLYTVNHFDTS